MLKINDKLSIPSEELQFHYARSSGPGGQNVNKVNSKSILEWDFENSQALSASARQRFIQKFTNKINREGFVIISSDQYRDRLRNCDDCLEKLKSMILEILVPPKKRRPTKPTKGSVESRLKGKRQQSEKKKQRQKFDY